MNGIQDLGGMDNIGPIAPMLEENEPVFHGDWERKVFGYTIYILGCGYYKVDEIRRTMELMPPADYLRAPYYEKWLYNLEEILVEKGVITAEELKAGKSLTEGFKLPAATPENMQYAMNNRIPASLDIDMAAPFRVGDWVIAKNINPPHHTRVPRYVRGRRGIIEEDWGVFPLPDTVAHGKGENPQHCYSVRFTAQELWGEQENPRDSLNIDLFDEYLVAA